MTRNLRSITSLRRAGYLALSFVTLGVVWVVAAGPAAAHVTVSASGAAAGSTDAVITFRVPTEEATASTTGLSLQLPIDTPLIGVKPADKPGWDAKVTTTTLTKPVKTDDGEVDTVVSQIDWTANPNAGIRPTYFGEFSIIAAQLPANVTKITFKAIQTYSNGEKTSWIQVAAPGSNAEPDDPAPVLELARTSASTDSDTTVTSTDAAKPTTSSGTSGLAVTGVALGAAALAAALAALAITLRRSRTARSSG